MTYPELFDNEDIIDVCTAIHHQCVNGCEGCPYANDLEPDLCHGDIIMELFRRLLNRDPELRDMHIDYINKRKEENRNEEI